MRDRPIWTILRQAGHSLAWLADQTTYTESYVRQVRFGSLNPSPRFRRLCAAALGQTATELFETAPSTTLDRTTERALVEEKRN